MISQKPVLKKKQDPPLTPSLVGDQGLGFLPLIVKPQFKELFLKMSPHAGGGSPRLLLNYRASPRAQDVAGSRAGARTPRGRGTGPASKELNLMEPTSVQQRFSFINYASQIMSWVTLSANKDLWSFLNKTLNFKIKKCLLFLINSQNIMLWSCWPVSWMGPQFLLLTKINLVSKVTSYEK